MTTLNNLVAHVREARGDIDQRIEDEERRLEDDEQASPSLRYLKVCTVNCWTKLDEYFAKVNDTPATYAACVTDPLMKWKYFEHTWKDASTWKDAKEPKTWLPNGKKALKSIWDEYKNLPIDEDLPCSGSKRARSPDAHERSFNMARLYGSDNLTDELDTWISTPPFELPLSETLGQYWIRQRKKESTNRLARIALDMLGIPAMSSDCERVFSQAKLMITGQRHRLKPDIIEACQCLRAWLIIDRKKLGKWEGSGNWTVPYEISTGSWE